MEYLYEELECNMHFYAQTIKYYFYSIRSTEIYWFYFCVHFNKVFGQIKTHFEKGKR